MKISDFNTEGKLGFIKTGEAIVRKDPIYLDGLTGKAHKCGTTDFAAVGGLTYGTPQTSEATGRIVAQTTTVGAVVQAYSRQAVLHHESGHIFAVSHASTNIGIKLIKFDPSGNISTSVDVDANASVTYNQHILKLYNGNIAVLWLRDSFLRFAIYNDSLAVVKAEEAIGGADYNFAACALSAGGFAAVYHDTVANLTSKLATYNNTGVAVLAPTTIWTRTGTNGGQYHKIAQLSNGNLAYAISSNNAGSSNGLYHGVTDVSGNIVAAFAALSAAVTTAWFPELDVMTGYYAIARPDGSNQKGYVLNNAGALQGSEFTAATTAGNSVSHKTKLINDGVAFYLIWHRSSDTKCVISKLPVTGTGYQTSIITTNVTQYNFVLDAFCEDGYICAASMSASTGSIAPAMWVIDASTMSLINPAGTTFGVAPGSTTGLYPRLISGGDRTFIAMYDYTTTAGTFLCVGKWAQTAILGVAAANAAADESVGINTLAGCYEINAIKGSHSKAFDMTANALVGNKGTLIANGACTLRGIGA